MAPELVKLARRNAGRVVVAKVDTESLPAAASRYGIQSIPTMILFRGGREARRILGAQPAGAVSDQLGI
jgi:thioredoxin 2